MAEKIAIDIEVKSEGGAQSLKDLKKELKDLQTQVSETKEGTEEYYEALKKIGETKDKIDDLNDSIAATTGAGRFQAIANVGAKIAAGFQLASSTMAMFGSESAEVEKALQKAQAAMAFVQGIKELEGLGDALKNAGSAIKLFVQGGISALRSLWATMLANPITAILVGLTALGGAIAWLATRESDETKALKENIAERERLMEAMDRQNDAVNKTAKNTIALAKAQGATEAELFAAEKKMNELRISQLAEQNNSVRENLAQIKTLLKNADGEEYNNLVDKYNSQAELLDKNKLEIKDIQNQILIDTANYNKKVKDDEEASLKERQSKYKEYLNKKREDEKAHNEKIKADLERNRNEELKNLENQRKAKELDGTLTYEDRKKYLDDVYALEIQKAGLMAEDLEELRLKHLENLKNLDAEEQKRKEEQAAKDLQGIKKDQADQLSEYETRIKTQQRLGEDSTALELEAAKYKLDTILNDENASYEQRLAAQEEYDAKKEELNKKALANEKAINDAKVQLTYDSLKLIGDIATAFAKEDEASQRKAFEINKKVQLAMATIDMIKGVQSAFTSAQASPFTAVFPGYPYVQAAMAAAYGIMNIRKISQTQFQGGGGTGAGGGMEGAAGATGGAVSAPIQGGVNNTSTMLENMGQGQQEQKPIKAYVLQTDVASEDQKIKAIENKSKIE